MQRVWLIARREVAAYATVPSFWAALLIGPVLMAVAAVALGAMVHPHPAPAQTIRIEAAEADVRPLVQGSLLESARLDGQAIRMLPATDADPAQTVLRVERDDKGERRVVVSGKRLSAVSLALLSRDLRSSAAAGTGRVSVQQSEPPLAAAPDLGKFSRFSITVVTWLVLVGSLGMLLQAVVRERSNRALESLLSAARPSDVLLGKLAGVGALSLLVIGVWFAGAVGVAASPIAASTGIGAALFGHLADATTLAFTAVLFLMTFGMYGAALIALGALAQDVPAAQNLSRPVFTLLLLIFFVAVAQVSGFGEASLAWLVLLPPFTPFVLMLAKPGTIDLAHAAFGLVGMLALTLAALRLGAQALRGERPLRPLASWRKAASP